MTKTCEKWYGAKHNWDKWKEIHRTDIKRSSDNAPIGLGIVQERQCQDCGFKEINYQTEYI